MKTMIQNVVKMAGLFDIIQFDEFGGYAFVIAILFQAVEYFSEAHSLLKLD